MSHPKKRPHSGHHGHHGHHGHRAKQFTALGNAKDRSALKKALRTGDEATIEAITERDSKADRMLRRTSKKFA